MSNVLRNMPSVNELLDSPPLKSLMQRLSRNVVVTRVGRILDGMRGQVQSAATALHVPSPADLAQRIADWIAAEEQPQARPVINATGILLHAELSGPPLAAEATQAMAALAGNYTAQTFLTQSERGSEREAAERLLARLTGAEAAIVAGSRFGAGFLTLSSLAAGREAVVSRGQIVDVPGNYLLPDLVAASGAMLREVGAANCTRLDDYAAAIGQRTAALLYVHTPNAAGQPSLAELATLARRRKLPLIADLANGALVDLSGYGIAAEPTVGEMLKTGADLVLFSGDQLLGGPACGLVAGRQEFMERIEAHALMPALGANRLALAALAATLQLYQDPQLAERSIPLLSLLATPLENLKNRAERLAPQLAAAEVAQVEVVKSEGRIAVGSGPEQAMASYALALAPVSGTAQELGAALREGRTPVVGRSENSRIVIDLRTVLPRQDAELVEAVEGLAPSKRPAESASDPSPAID